jgi:REP element-mobilizing transposase RayT
MHAYLGGVCEKHLSPVLAVGGTEDHAHILCRLAKNVSVEEILRDMKRASS